MVTSKTRTPLTQTMSVVKFAFLILSGREEKQHPCLNVAVFDLDLFLFTIWMTYLTLYNVRCVCRERKRGEANERKLCIDKNMLDDS